MKLELNEQQLTNLMIFLNRVPITGMSEISAMNEILSLLTKKEEITK